MKLSPIEIMRRLRSICPTAVIPKCAEAGCELVMAGLSNYVILKGEELATDRKIGDCLVFVAGAGIAIGIIELKSRTIRASDVREKLLNSSELAVNLLESCGVPSARYDLYHLVLARGRHAAAQRALTRKRITFRGRKFDIIAKRCGTSLAAILSLGAPSSL